MRPLPTLSRRNIELKARLRDLAAARRTAEAVATDYLGVQRQIDTYFHCRQGRLKLREIEGSSAQLVSYSRPDCSEAKASDYHLVDVPDAAAMKQALAAALGVRLIVEKRREIFLAGNVRIHLDEVESLGTFLEFEAVLGSGVDNMGIDVPGSDSIGSMGLRCADAAGHDLLRSLSAQFGLRPDDLLAGSYADLLAR